MNCKTHIARPLRTVFLCVALAIGFGGTMSGAAAQATHAPEQPAAFALQEPAGSALSTSIDWNTFLGGEGHDAQPAIAIDRDGNIFVTGRSDETWGDPIRENSSPGSYLATSDVFVAKLDPQGHLLWNTFLGSDDMEFGARLAVDADGSVFVSGWATHTWGSPIRPLASEGYSIDLFVAKVDSDGNLAWNTFLGGDGHEEYGHIATDSDGFVYVTGSSGAAWGCSATPCTNRPFVGGDEPTDMDGFVAKLDPDGYLIWNTFLGGSATDFAGIIAITPAGDFYVGGQSRSDWGCPSANCTQRAFVGDVDGFLALLDSDGDLLWNTFLGGAGADYSNSIVLRRDGQIAVSGGSDQAWSCTEATCTLRPYSDDSDAFVAVLDPNGVLRWNTFLGSAAMDYCTGLAEDTSGRLYVAGSSYETWGKPDREYADFNDAYVAILEPSGNLLWNSFFGTWDHDLGGGIALTADDEVVLSGYGESSWGSPIRPFSRDSDVFVTAFYPDIFPEDSRVWLPWAQVR